MSYSRWEDRIRAWARAFRAGELTVEDVQERFAALDVMGADLPPDLAKAVASAQQALDAIRFGMCESGQRGEIMQVFEQLERLGEQPRDEEAGPSLRSG